MTQAAPDPPLPPPRVLQGWWRDISTLRPRRLWFGQLLFHHVEVLVEVDFPIAVDPLQRLLLRALASSTALPALDAQLLSRLLGGLATDGLLCVGPHGWEPTDAGRAAMSAGMFTRRGTARRTFVFVDRSTSDAPC